MPKEEERPPLLTEREQQALADAERAHVLTMSVWRQIAAEIDDIRATPFEKHLLAAILLAVMQQ
jgi:hypothetical protein